ncbi:MAG: hypothetical protein M3P94_07195 [Chloroflexota bacterium]|nr:hypothetical protein [Chloroflexota bacterium]
MADRPTPSLLSHPMRRRAFLSAAASSLGVAALVPPGSPGSGLAAQGMTPFAESSPGADDAPDPITFPEDDGPHEAAVEWWYYTGHLFADDGRRFGFEQVVFKGERSGTVGYASHVAITDAAAGTFTYDQRLAGPETSVPGSGFNLVIGDWAMRGEGGADRLRLTLPGYVMAISLTATKSPVLHDGDGYIDYGNGQASYYYSRTRMAVEGILDVGGESLPVTGEAWMDHQWGDFDTFSGGGWDWYSVQLDDRSDLMLYLINAPDGTPIIVDGSLVAADGTLTILDGDDFTVAATGEWTSEATGITYPSGWDISVPAEDLILTLSPTLRDQELDTTDTTGVIYWEGEVTVAGERAGAAIAGLGYVELTGYGDRT